MNRKRTLIFVALVCLAAIPALLIARPPLFTISNIPNSNIEPGQTFTYQIAHTVEDPACLAEGPFFSLQSGPSGMTVSSSGLITWNVPSSPNNYTQSVTVKGLGWRNFGSPCGGGTYTDTESFTITVC